jgi:hypothetical protein
MLTAPGAFCDKKLADGNISSADDAYDVRIDRQQNTSRTINMADPYFRRNLNSGISPSYLMAVSA